MKFLVKLLPLLYLIFLFTVALPEERRAVAENTTENPIAPKISIKIAKDIQDRMPVGVDSVFDISLGKVYCWSSLSRVESDTITIYHIWNYGGVQQARIPIEITSATFRAYTFQTLNPEQIGDWTVYIVDANDNVLGQTRFRVVAGKS